MRGREREGEREREREREREGKRERVNECVIINRFMNSISQLYQRRALGIRIGSTSLRHRDVTILAESKDAGIIPLVESHSERVSER